MPQVVLVYGAPTAPTAALIAELYTRYDGKHPEFGGLHFVLSSGYLADAEALADRLGAAFGGGGAPAGLSCFVVSPVPSLSDPSYRGLAHEYAGAMRNAGMWHLVPSTNALDGYLTGMRLAEAAEEGGREQRACDLKLWVHSWNFSTAAIESTNFSYTSNTCGEVVQAPAQQPLLFATTGGVFPGSPVIQVARSMADGLLGAFAAANAGGGINGRLIRLVHLGDGYSTPNAIRNTELLFREYPDMFALVGPVGTGICENLARYMVYNSSTTGVKFAMFSPMTGSSLMYTQPYANTTRTIRTCYNQEAALWASHFAANFNASQKLAILYWDTEFGNGVLHAIRDSMGQLGRTITREVPIPPVVDNFYSYLSELMRCDPDAIGLVAVLSESFITALLAMAKPNTIFYTLSVASSNVPRQAVNSIYSTGSETAQMLVSQVLPPPFLPTPASKRFLQEMTAYYPETSNTNFVAYEGYLSGWLLVDAMRNNPNASTPQELIDAIDSLGAHRFEDLALGPFSNEHNNAINKTWLTKIITLNSTYQDINFSLSVRVKCDTGAGAVTTKHGTNTGVIVGATVSAAAGLALLLAGAATLAIAAYIMRKRRQNSPVEVMPVSPSEVRLRKRWLGGRCAFIHARKFKLLVSRFVLILIAVFVIVAIVTGMIVISTKQSTKAVMKSVDMLAGQVSVSVSQLMRNIYETPILQAVQNSNFQYDFNASTDRNSWPNWVLTFYKQRNLVADSRFTKLYLGRLSGEICGMRATDAGSVEMFGTCPEGTTGMCSWAIDSEGHVVGYPSAAAYSGTAQNARQTAWWIFPELSRRPTWSGLVRDGADLFISFSAPVIHNGIVDVVFAVDFSLAQLSEQLQSISLSHGSVVVTAEIDGSVIASSDSGMSSFVSETSAERSNLLTYPDNRLRCAARHFANKLGNENVLEAFYTNSNETLLSHISCSGEMIYTSLSNYVDPTGTTTAIFLVTPEKDFTATIEKNNRVTLALFISVMFAFIVLAVGGLILFTRTYARIASQDDTDATDRGNIDSGVQKIIKTLRNIIETSSDRNVAVALQSVITLLTQNSLYQPNLEKAVADRDIHDWLKNEFSGCGGGGRTQVVPNTLERAMSDTSLSVASIACDATYFETHDLTSWAFDILDFADVLRQQTCGGPSVLFHSVLEIVRMRGLLAALDVPLKVFKRFLCELESAYVESNPYHNAVHAADVTLCVNYIMRPEVVQLLRLSPLDVLTVLIAAAGHDAGHDGRNNSFHVTVETDRALMFNSRSVQENFHVQKLLRLIRELGLFTGLPAADAKYSKNLITDMILATDMTLHFDFTGKLAMRLENPQFNPAEGADKALVLQMLLKFADISNPCKPLPLMRKWSGRVAQEFFLQGDTERALGLPVSAFMDRYNANVIKSQQGFVQFIVSPMAELVSKLLAGDALATPRECLKQTAAYWTSENPSVDADLSLR
eukprot:TRINITY_DN3469_c1_g1_i1.p1 TRINITY_DN3469_c1_g1~~TRINITY_DN3469_c1_g1_i1.p1  ORF type:complete len:1616 (-),score=411.79 TRINITY_DN3469_c1_g1_i1:43-4401(-)